MKLSEILTLAKAGYSRKDILAMEKAEAEEAINNGYSVSANEASPAPNEDVKVYDSKATTPTAKAEEASASSEPAEVIADSTKAGGSNDEIVNLISERLGKLEESIRHNNRINAEMPEQETPEDALINYFERMI